MIIDTHAHYDSEAFDEDRAPLLNSMKEAGVGLIVDVGAAIKDLDKVCELTREYPFIYGAAGIHPDDAGMMTEEVYEKIGKLLKEKKIVAVGEIGLDYYWHKDAENHQIQKQVFARQMDIARTAKKPFMIHSRDAAEDTLEIVKQYMKTGEMSGGIIHCFSYSKEMARQYLEMGLYLGIGGVVTFKNARKLKEVVEDSPLEQLVLETDSPYLSPEPNRGKRNCSKNLIYVAREIARIKGTDVDNVIRITEENARKLLKLD